MDTRFWEELHAVENHGSTRTAILQTMRRRNFPRRQTSQGMALGLRDSQIMLDPSAQRQREQQRQFEREVAELFSRLSSSSQTAVVEREPGSHRLLHRRNSTPKLQKKPAKLTFMRI